MLNDERSILYDRIDRRVDQMICDGLVDEVFRLKEMGYTRDLVSMQGLGYKELFPVSCGRMHAGGGRLYHQAGHPSFCQTAADLVPTGKGCDLADKPDFDYDEEKILSYMLDRWNEIVSADAKEEGEQSC